MSSPEEMKPSHSGGDRGGWDEEEVLAADDGSDMEGWEDDGWGDFGGNKTTPPAPSVPSSGADFFDTFQGGFSPKTKEKDYFSDFDSMATPSSKKEKSPPPLVSASLFGGEMKTGQESAGGWGDWGDDFGSTKPKVQK